MTEPRETSSWNAIRHSVVPSLQTQPPAKSAPAKPETVRLSEDAAKTGTTAPAGVIASNAVGLGATEVAVTAEINAKADEFVTLADANRHLNKGQNPTGTTQVPPPIAATVTLSRRDRNGTVRTETRTVGWMRQYEGLQPQSAGRSTAAPSSRVDRTYNRNVDQVVDIAGSILAELKFLEDAPGVEGSSYRSLETALDAVKSAPSDRHALLSLYGEMITFVQLLRQGDLADRADFRTFLNDNYDSFSEGASGAGGVKALVSNILSDLKVKDVAALQQDKLGMKGAAVTGKFDAQTYFATQLYVIEQMANNLSKRDGLGMSTMQQSVKEAKADVDRLVDLGTNFADRLKQNTLSSSTTSFLSSLGYKVEDGALKTADGTAVAESQLNELSAQWLEQATYLAQKSHQDVQEAMALHGGYLTTRQRKQVEGWVRAYELFYNDTMTRGTAPAGRTSPSPAANAYGRTGSTQPLQLPGDGGTIPAAPPPEQPDVTDAMAVATLEQIAIAESGQPAPDPGKVDDPGELDARRMRGARIAHKMEQFYGRLKDGVDVGTLSDDERRSVATLTRHGFIRKEGNTVYLTATEAQLREFSQMADTLQNPESPAAAAILNTVVKAYEQTYALATLKEDVLGIPRFSSDVGTFLAALAPAVTLAASSPVPVREAESADDTPPPAPPTVVHPDPGPEDEAETRPDDREIRPQTSSAPSGAPGGISLLRHWPEAVQDQREERERHAEKVRQQSIESARAYDDAVQVAGAKAVRERREDAQSTGTTVVRGADGKAVGVITTGDGQVIGVNPAVDPGKAAE